jgi:threonine/homoserine/homoserine lactone efflux protein
MDLLLLGAGMGIVGGVMPSPLHMIALAQVALKRWFVAILVLVGAPLSVDGSLLLLTFFFYRYIPSNIAHYVAYVGGVALIGFGTFSLLETRHKTPQQMGHSSALTHASVSVATLTELASPGTWVYWLTVAGPIIAEGRRSGYWHIVPFFAGSVVGYYGAAVLSLLLMAWGAGLHEKFRQRLFLIANVLLLILGVSYLLRAHFSH